MTGDGAVRVFLDMPLDAPRIHNLEIAADMVAALPPAGILAELQTILAARITGDEYHRLHVLASTLHHRHHRAGASLPTEQLRAAIEAARTREEVNHVVPER